MTSKIRLLTIIFSLTILLVFGRIPYLIFLKKGLNEINIATVTAILMSVLFLGGIIAIFWFTLIVKIGKHEKEITFFYPFRLRKKTAKFDEILGFRYKYLSGKIEYKALEIKTKSGHTFTFSDFETANLREFEEYFIEHFELRKGNTFSRLSQKNKDYEIQKSKAFDYEQAKEIRFYLFLAIGGCVFIIGTIITKLLVKESELSQMSIIAIFLSLIILIPSILKLKRTGKIIKNGA